MPTGEYNAAERDQLTREAVALRHDPAALRLLLQRIPAHYLRDVAWAVLEQEDVAPESIEEIANFEPSNRDLPLRAYCGYQLATNPATPGSVLAAIMRDRLENPPLMPSEIRLLVGHPNTPTPEKARLMRMLIPPSGVQEGIDEFETLLRQAKQGYQQPEEAIQALHQIKPIRDRGYYHPWWALVTAIFQSPRSSPEVLRALAGLEWAGNGMLDYAGFSDYLLRNPNTPTDVLAKIAPKLVNTFPSSPHDRQAFLNHPNASPADKAKIVRGAIPVQESQEEQGFPPGDASREELDAPLYSRRETRDPNTPPERLREIGRLAVRRLAPPFEGIDGPTITDLVENPSTDAGTLQFLYDVTNRIGFIGRGGTWIDYRGVWSRDFIKHPNFPTPLKAKLVREQMPVTEARYNALFDEILSHPEEDLHLATQVMAARDPTAPVEVLLKLAGSRSEIVRKCVLRHPNTPRPTVARLMRQMVPVTETLGPEQEKERLKARHRELQYRSRRASASWNPAELEQIVRKTLPEQGEFWWGPIIYATLVNRATPPSALRQIWQAIPHHQDAWHKDLATHHNTPADVLLDMAQHTNERDTLLLITKHPASAPARALAMRRLIPDQAVESLQEEGDGWGELQNLPPETPEEQHERERREQWTRDLTNAQHSRDPEELRRINRRWPLNLRSAVSIMFQLLRNPATPGDVLARIVGAAAEEKPTSIVRTWLPDVVKHPNADAVLKARALRLVVPDPPDEAPVQEGRLRHHVFSDWGRIWAKASNPRTNPDLLSRYARSRDQELHQELLRRVAANPATPPEALEFLARHEDEEHGYAFRHELLRNPATPRALKAKLLRQMVPDAPEVTETRRDPIGPDSGYDDFRQMLQEFGTEGVRFALLLRLAADPDAPADILQMVAKEPAPTVRRRLINNPATPRDLKATLLRAEIPDVVEALLEEERDTPAVDVTGPDWDSLRRWNAATDPKTGPDVLRALAHYGMRGISVPLREFVRELLKHPNLSSDTLAEIYFWNGWGQVPAGLLLHHRNTPAEVLAHLANERFRDRAADHPAKRLIAAHPNTPRPLAAQILRSIVPTTESLAEDEQDFSAMDPMELLAMAEDPDLQPEVADKLLRWVTRHTEWKDGHPLRARFARSAKSPEIVRGVFDYAMADSANQYLLSYLILNPELPADLVRAIGLKTKEELAQPVHRTWFDQLPRAILRHPKVDRETAAFMTRAMVPDVAESLSEAGRLVEDEQPELFGEMPEQPPRRRITITYDRTTPESVEQGDTSESGWIDEEGVDMEPHEWEEDESVDAVDKAVEFLRVAGAIGDEGTDWFYTEYSTIDYSTGEEESRHYHLEGFSDEEKDAIHALLTGRAVERAPLPILKRVFASLDLTHPFYGISRAIKVAQNPHATPEMLDALAHMVFTGPDRNWYRGDLARAITRHPNTPPPTRVKLMRGAIPTA